MTKYVRAAWPSSGVKSLGAPDPRINLSVESPRAPTEEAGKQARS